MVAARIVAPHTKLATTRWWHTTTLAEDFGVADADEDELYAAMDWLLERQDAIQKKLAARHLSEGGLVLYDLSSSYFEGTHCPLAKLGYNRDGKKGMLQVNYGLLTDARGCPVAVSVHEGNVADSPTLLPAGQRLREDFGIEQMVMVGDRGMISQQGHRRDARGRRRRLDHGAQERVDPRAGRARAPAAGAVRRAQSARAQLAGLPGRAAGGVPQSGSWPSCARTSARNLLAATEANLEKIKARVDAGKLDGADDDRLARGQASSTSTRSPSTSSWPSATAASAIARKLRRIAAEAALDGIYIIRTSVRADADGRARRACATTSRWPTSSARSARSRRST